MSEIIAPEFFIIGCSQEKHWLKLTFKSSRQIRIKDNLTDTNGVGGYVVKVIDDKTILIDGRNVILKCGDHFQVYTHASPGIFEIKPEFLHLYIDRQFNP